MNEKLKSLFIRQDSRIHALNSISSSLISYIIKHLKEKLDEEQFKGMIFSCDKQLFPRYSEDFNEILDVIGYFPIAQDIPKSEKIDEYIKKRLIEHLPKDVQQRRTNNYKGSITVPIGSFEGGSGGETTITYDRPETLTGLIEHCLKSQNIMLIITNTDEIDLNGLEPIIGQIFAARSDEYKAALTLVQSILLSSNRFLKPESWFIFAPQTIVEQKDFIDFVWANLSPKHQKLFGNSIILSKFLKKSLGSRGILRQKWNEEWEKEIT